MNSLGTNIVYTIDGTILALHIDLSQTHGRSASGKNLTVASTGGNVTIPGTEIKLGLNAYKKP